MWESQKEKRKLAALCLIFIAGFALILIQAWNWHNKVLEDMLEKHENVLVQIAGAEAMGESPIYAVTQALKGLQDIEWQKAGRNVLESAGYQNGYLKQQEGALRRFRLLFKVTIFVGLICISAGFWMLYRAQKLKYAKELLQLSELLDQFRGEKYENLLPNYQEGIYGKINDKLQILQQTLKAKDTRMKDEKEATKVLVTDIAHQLKTPLASLNTSFALLQEEDLTEEERNEFMETSSAQLLRLERLIGALLNISRMETGMIVLKPKCADIAQTIEEAVEIVASKAEQKGIAIIKEHIFPVMLQHDPKWTAEAIANILDNDIKYSPRNSKINIRMNRKIMYLQISIEDEGIGIRTEEKHKIFQRFYRGSAWQVASQEGAGVGLYLTRKIVEDQGGTVWVRNRRKETNGSVFLLQLPLSEDKER